MPFGCCAPLTGDIAACSPSGHRHGARQEQAGSRNAVRRARTQVLAPCLSGAVLSLARLFPGVSVRSSWVLRNTPEPNAYR
jgi:hypothetical protein